MIYTNLWWLQANFNNSKSDLLIYRDRITRVWYRLREPCWFCSYITVFEIFFSFSKADRYVDHVSFFYGNRKTLFLKKSSQCHRSRWVTLRGVIDIAESNSAELMNTAESSSAVTPRNFLRHSGVGAVFCCSCERDDQI